MKLKKNKLENYIRIQEHNRIRKKNILKRNLEIQTEFSQMYKKNPNIRYEVILEMLGDKYCLSTLTIHRILKKNF